MAHIEPLGTQEKLPWGLLLLADPSRKMIERYLDHAGIFVLKESDAILGVMVLTANSDPEMEIRNIAVHPQYQGNGYGKLLIEHAISIARAAGFARLMIGTANSSLAQLALYQKMGFRITGVWPDFFTDNYPSPLEENGLQVRNMIRLTLELS